jgi:DNA-binding transcriptional LysR family regulator
MRLFVRVAELGSFRKAAREFGMSNPCASRCVATLESRLGVRLIVRSTRALKITECGERYLESCRSWLENLTQLESGLLRMDEEPSGTLRILSCGARQISCPSSFLHGFQKKHPGIGLRLTVLEHDIDCLDAGFDVAIATNFAGSEANYSVVPILRSALVCVASPAYLEQHGTPTKPSDLLVHLHVGMPVDSAGVTWSFRNAVNGIEKVELVPVYAVNSPMGICQAALDGMGFAILPEESVERCIEARALVPLLPEFSIDDADVVTSLVFRSKEAIPARVRAFVDFAIHEFCAESQMENHSRDALPRNTSTSSPGDAADETAHYSFPHKVERGALNDDALSVAVDGSAPKSEETELF